MCLQTTKQTVQINFSELTRNPQSTTSTGFDTNNTIRTQFSRYNNIGDMHNQPAWSIGRIQSSKTATLLNNHKSTHLSVIPPQNGKITIKTEKSSKYNNEIVVENTSLFQLSIDDLLLITITITSNSFNDNTNNSIEGNIPLFSAKQKHPTIFEWIRSLFRSTFRLSTDQQLHLVNNATYTRSLKQKKHVYKYFIAFQRMPI
jgi:hypothetical protein